MATQAAVHPAWSARTAAETQSIPWYVWNFLAAVVFVGVGGTWDISWHISIGRDELLSPPHILVYLCGILAGLGSAWLILSTTFDRQSPLRAASISMWGFHGPLGAFLAAWGGTAMIASAPFDDWWHNAYGLDTKVLSPPHIVLILGILAIEVAALLIALGEMNRAEGKLKKKLTVCFVILGAMLLRTLLGSMIELTSRNLMHTARFYLVLMILAPFGLAMVATASRHRWGMTLMMSWIMSLSLFFLWFLPLFPAEPKLGPVFQKVTHFIPTGGFPTLLILAAVAGDLVRRRLSERPFWQQAAVGGVTIFSVFLAAQWPFAAFLQTEAARNWFFGSHYLPYFMPSTHDLATGRFTVIETESQFWIRMALAPIFAICSYWIGLRAGIGMQRIRR